MPSISKRIKSGATAAADLQQPRKGVQGGEQNEALCVLGKLAGQVFRYIFSGADFKFLYLLTCRKALKSFMVTSAPCD